ncbi:MAG: sigma-70 family RNA polymerase sigma factor [Flavobacteriales bacterium]
MAHIAHVVESSTSTHTSVPPLWVSGLLRNDPAVIHGLYASHYPAVRQYVVRNSGTASDAQDVFQEAVTVLWLQVKEGRFAAQADPDPGGFLFRVAKNKWLDVLRSAAHRNMKVLHDGNHQLTFPEVDHTDEERIMRLRGVYDKLDHKCRQVLDQFYFERKDLASIAANMGVEEESIRTIKYRCMMKLRAFRRAISGEEGADK